jgi:hypothetical protein
VKVDKDKQSEGREGVKESEGGERVRRVKVEKGKESEGGEGVSRVKVEKG